MATTITTQAVADKTPILATYEAVAATMEFAWTGREVIHVKNGVTAMTIAVLSESNCDQGFDHDTSQVVGSSEDWFFSARSDRFKDSGDKVQLTISDVTDGTIAVLVMPT